MSVFKNTQIAKLFKVSHTTVSNWIEAAEKNLVDLELTTIGKRRVIIDNSANREILQRLVAKGKKHIGRSNRVIVKTNPNIKDIFTPTQIYELYANLSSRLEIPYKFTYLNHGSDLWDQHYKLSLEDSSARRSQEYKLIIDNIDSIGLKLKGFKKIHIFDIGCGNGYPASEIISKLKNLGLNVTYSAIDISKNMIKLCKKNLLNKFPDLIFSSFILDLDYSNISEILLDSKKDSDTINLLLYLGGTLGNQSEISRVFGNLRDSMSLNDILLVGNSISEGNSKNPALRTDEYHYRRTSWILDILGLKGMYPDSVLNDYNIVTREYTRRIPINKNVTINFEFDNKVLPITINEFDEILVYRYKEFKETELIQQVVERGFMIEQFVTNRSGTYALMLARPKQI